MQECTNNDIQEGSSFMFHIMMLTTSLSFTHHNPTYPTDVYVPSLLSLHDFFFYNPTMDPCEAYYIVYNKVLLLRETMMMQM